MYRPLASVIIPVYNGERYLAEAIGSALNQTYTIREIIVVDDGSTDSSAEVAKRFASAVRYCYRPNAGAGCARKRGEDMARGSFLAFLDSDDIWLERQESCLRSSPVRTFRRSPSKERRS